MPQQIHLHRRHRQALPGGGRRHHHGVRGPVAADAARRLHLHHRPFRLRQDHGAQHPGRARRAVGRHRDRRQPGDRGPEPRPRGDLPDPRAAAVALGDGQRRLRGVVEMAQVEGAAGARAGAEVHRSRRPHRRRGQAPGRALRRHEAARRHRARALDRAEDHADGRAVLGARRAHPRHLAGRGAPHLPGDRADRVHDHPRRRRGDLSRRPHRADDQRPRRGAGRGRGKPAAEGARAHRGAQASALLSGAQPHHRFPGQPLEDLRPRSARDLRPAQHRGGAAGRSARGRDRHQRAAARPSPRACRDYTDFDIAQAGRTT